jgi:hypothetical protein
VTRQAAAQLVASIPEAVSLAEELLGQVVAFRPICDEAGGGAGGPALLLVPRLCHRYQVTCYQPHAM